ncbi:histidine kinase [Pseudoalteromonas sp. A25]|uniref:Hpt domain-containing protein n=1 Tax=Pseudoalteromonas sp. A25 TaxID=116092 RepID=UPI00129FC3E1|nr:Hpt domain-containing protein [Pseudoalteromonas sp. A25]BBN81652.1 histidine kinase [Pseudoalteromonas sp. A25]
MIDNKIFSQLCNDVGEELALQLLSVFVTESRKQINELNSSENIELIQHLAHSLKSSSRSYGAILLAQTCELIEMATKHQEITLNELSPLIEKATVLSEEAFSDAITLIANKH